MLVAKFAGSVCFKMSIKKILIKEIKLTVKDWVFGGEDGLMVTFGALFGMSIATNENNLIILAGLLANLSNAVSMAAGDYLSTKSQAEVHKHEGFENPILSAIVMFVVCLLGALIILPFLFVNMVIFFEKIIANARLNFDFLGFSVN